MSKKDKKTLENLLHSGHLSRRGMMKLLSSSAIAGSSMGLMGMPGLSLAEDKPVLGGKMRAGIANASAIDTLDPAKGNNTGDYTRQFMFYSGLTELNAKNEVHPALAESIDSEDGKVWKIKLRSGVTFHNGKALTADDVVWSLARHKDPEVGSSAFKLAEQFAKITAISSSEVNLELTQANVDLPIMLATSYFLIVPKDTKDFSKGIGTGPFILKDFRPGITTVGTKNKNYWKSGLPYLDEVELLGMTDEAARVNALRAGDVLFIDHVSGANATQLKEGGQTAILESKSGSYINLIANKSMLPGKNDDFVTGLSYLLPREMLVKTVLQGYGDVANDTPVPPWHPYYNPELKPKALDPEKAKFYFQKSGLTKKTFEIISTPNIAGSVETGQLVQQMSAGTGIDFKVRRVPYDGYWSQHWTKDPLGFGSIVAKPTLDIVFSLFYMSNATSNESHWSNPKFDQLVIAARSEKDAVKRKQMYFDMQTLIYEHCGTLIPYFISALDGYSPNKLGGVIPWQSGLMMGYRFHEFVWRKES